MELDQQIARAFEWNTELNKLIDGELLTNLDTNTKIRLRVSLPLLTQSLEHYHGIIVLVENKLFGSARALLRPQIETHVRGIWFQSCATDDEIKLFTKKESKPPPLLGKLIEEIEKLGVYKNNCLSGLFGKIRITLNDYTHGGIEQVMARNTDKEIVSTYNPKEIAKLIESSAVFVALAAITIANIAENSVLAKDLMATYERLYGTVQ